MYATLGDLPPIPDVLEIRRVRTEPYRRRGFGNAMTLATLHTAREEGWQTAVLQASPEGQAVYRHLGFETAGSFTEHSITPAHFT